MSVYKHIYVCISYTRICTYTHAYIYRYIHVYLYIYIYIYIYNLLYKSCSFAPQRLRKTEKSAVYPPINLYYLLLHWFIPKSIIDSLFLHIHYWFHSTGRLPFPQVPEHYCLKIIRFVANLHCRQNSARGPFLL